jgi:hypothetical protein
MVRAMTDGPRGTFDTDTARVRLVLMRELETISVYEALARDAQGLEARAFFEHLAREEKEHVAEATYLLRKLDAGQEEKFQASYSEAHFQETIGAANPSAAETQPAMPAPAAKPLEPIHTVGSPPASPSAVAGAFTVGPLKGKR